MRNKKAINKIFTEALQNFEKFDTLNPVKIKVDEDEI